MANSSPDKGHSPRPFCNRTMTGKLYDARSEESPKYLAGSSSYASDSDICPGLSGSYLRGKDSSGRESILYLLRSAFRQAKRPLSGSGILPSRPRTIRFILCRRGKSRQTMRTGKTIVPTHAASARHGRTPSSVRFPEERHALIRALSRTRPANRLFST